MIALLVLLFVIAFLMWGSSWYGDTNENSTSLPEVDNISTLEPEALEILSEILVHFQFSKREKERLPYNVSGYEEGFEGLVSNGTAIFKVAVFVYENTDECIRWFKGIERDLNASLVVVNSSEGESCVWRLFSGNESYYIECSEFRDRGVLLIGSKDNVEAVERLSWWFPTQSCVRPGTKLVVQVGSPGRN